MAIKVFTLDNLKYYHGKIKELLAGKVDKVEGKGLSANDYTDAEKAKLAGVAEGAQVNVIESVMVDGVAQTIADKGVTLDLSAYAKKSDIVNAVDFRGIVATEADLPTGAENGDVYHVTEKSAEYIWIAAANDGAGAWEELGSILDLSAYSTTEQMNTAIQNAIAGKANSADVYTKTEVDGQVDALEQSIGTKANAADVYTKTEVDGFLATKAVKSEVEAALALKADADAVYTKTEVDGMVAVEAFTEAEIDTAIA